MRKGEKSSKLVNQALLNLTDTGGKYAGGAIAQSTTLAGKFSTLIDNIEALARVIAKTLEPALKNILDIANKALGAINKLLASEFQRGISSRRANLAIPGNTVSDVNS